ncbi:synaptic vesicle VAT-1 family membrane protein [Fulvivirga sedimenti]|uniref:Medium chain dehydrogenase/reductase family protein n=1 Tax=Fulvivirga sedimenti TaxID=2879465 RepID=A0A9X1HV84_9BACT|nr:medium chain dehydrogenase/reductase family protein [Fulvivirga sedimenti]MCA6074517.1 medium chain dehydrogenase/reductase family protein [Fulvivirga sedimenti]MCA6075694.1 medium chain dehydrogenase/reductase family protein [Fulvivirga sedimenti]MCA6076822.1 medium chain dehydrogenase/reductase family protein [Fulvivirga sedimenti]
MSGEREVYRIDKAGNLKRLLRKKEGINPPEPDEVQVKVKSIGLNFADIFAILGLYSATPKESFIPGLEYSGIVETVGARVTGFKPGDKVMGVTRFGGYATMINIDQDYLVPLPDSWSYEEGAAFLVQALTAYYGLYSLGDLKPGKTVLIHSAAGGVGLLANRMAQKSGAYTIGTVGSASKVELLKKEGYQGWIVRDQNFRENLMKSLSGRSLDIVMECIGGDILKAGYEALAPQGRMIVYGSARYGDTSNTPNWIRLARLYLARPKIDPQKMIESNKGILGFNLIWLYDQKALMHQIIPELHAMELEAPYVGHTFEFDQLPEALKLFQSGKTMGKVVIRTPA